jgi:hypothetical protein
MKLRFSCLCAFSNMNLFHEYTVQNVFVIEKLDSIRLSQIIELGCHL